MFVQYATPSTLEESQDQLLLAGSKLTFADIYNKQMDIPPVKGKYYRADDVDNTFILMNGVLTDVSQQAFRKNKQMVELQEEVSRLRSDITKLEHDVSTKDNIQELLHKREGELKKLAIASKQKIDFQQQEITRLNQENDQLGDVIERLINRINELESQL